MVIRIQPSYSNQYTSFNFVDILRVYNLHYFERKSFSILHKLYMHVNISTTISFSLLLHVLIFHYLKHYAHNRIRKFSIYVDLPFQYKSNLDTEERKKNMLGENKDVTRMYVHVIYINLYLLRK